MNTLISLLFTINSEVTNKESQVEHRNKLNYILTAMVPDQRITKSTVFYFAILKSIFAGLGFTPMLSGKLLINVVLTIRELKGVNN
jgi:hypothetical protein